MLVDHAEIEESRVEVIADGLLGHHDRLWHEAAFGADQNPGGSCCGWIGYAAWRIRILVRRSLNDRDHLDLGAVSQGPGHSAETVGDPGAAGPVPATQEPLV